MRIAPSPFTRRMTGVFLVAVCLLAAAGCGGDNSTGPSGRITGSYVLRDVDDEGLPVTIHQGPWLDPVNVTFYNKYILQVTGGVIELHDDDRFTMTISADANADGLQWSPTLVLGGSYEVDDGEVWFWVDGYDVPAGSAAISRGIITLTIDLMSKGVSNDLHFRK
jgi:hypothetical protein